MKKRDSFIAFEEAHNAVETAQAVSSLSSSTVELVLEHLRDVVNLCGKAYGPEFLKELAEAEENRRAIATLCMYCGRKPILLASRSDKLMCNDCASGKNVPPDKYPRNT